jgi:hypothetical protein
METHREVQGLPGSGPPVPLSGLLEAQSPGFSGTLVFYGTFANLAHWHTGNLGTLATGRPESSALRLQIPKILGSLATFTSAA